MFYRLSAIAALLLSVTYGSPVMAQSFSDVPQSHSAYEAIEALKNAGILSGYPDGTFKPGKSVNRAEAVKIIVAPLLNDEQIAQAHTSVYDDVPDGVWFLPYVEWARQAFKILDGPPKKTSFHGERPVILVEFLKMLEVANGIDPAAMYGEITLPLSNDVTNVSEWYYPYMRYALSASMLAIDQQGKLHPAKQLTRADTAQLLYFFLLYRQEARTQALLNQAERNISLTLQAWDGGLIQEAEYASARALLAARGAHASRTEPITKGAVKIAEAFRSLVRGYRAGVEKNFAEAERLAGEAWNYSSEAISHSPGLSKLAEQIRTIAKNMAESARSLKGN